MASLNENTYRLFGRISPNVSDDSVIDIRELKSAYHKKRAVFLRNELNKNRSIDPHIIQDLGCVELEVADRADCCDIDIECSILRTVLEIPNTIELHSDDPLWVSPIDKLNYQFSYVRDLERARWSGNGRFNINNIYVFKLNRRIYIISKNDEHKYLTHINIRGVFEDPTDAARFSNCTSGLSCYTDDSTYPLNEWMADAIENSLFEEFTTKLKLPIDNSNNAKGDPIPQGGTK